MSACAVSPCAGLNFRAHDCLGTNTNAIKCNFPLIFSRRAYLHEQDFGRHVERTPSHLFRSALISRIPSQPKVGQLNMPPRVEQHIFRLDIPVNNAHRVEVLKGEQYLRRPDPRIWFAKESVLAQVHEKLAAIDKVHHQAQRRPSLKRIVKLDNEGVIDNLQHSTLLLRVFNLAKLAHVALVQNFERKDLICELLAHLPRRITRAPVRQVGSGGAVTR